MEDGVGAEGEVPVRLGGVEPDAGLEPLAALVDEADQRDRDAADRRRQPGEVVVFRLVLGYRVRVGNFASMT